MRSPPPREMKVLYTTVNCKICCLSPVRKVNTITLLDDEAVNVFL